MDINLRVKSKAIPLIAVEKLASYKGSDLYDLAEAAASTLKDNLTSFTIGFNRGGSPSREQLESYWRGVVLVPERVLIVGRIDRVICSAIQLVKPPAGNFTSSFAACVENHF